MKRILHWLFPTGATLTIGGVLSELLLLWDARHAFTIPTDLAYAMGVTMSLSLLGGPLLLIVGSITDRVFLPIVKTRPRGNLCWIIGIGSIALIATHRFGFDDPFIFLMPPVCAGLIGGIVLHTKPE